MPEAEKLVCQICEETRAPDEGTMADSIRPSLAEFIRTRHPDFDPHKFVCFADLATLRNAYLKSALEEELGELSTLDREVIASLQEHDIVSENIGHEFEKKLSFGERLSDRIADFGGSWRFIILFGAVLFGWIGLNVIAFANRGFDPYPFILLNLILSCVAALQAPVIMMSQNRAEERDRLRAENDYKVNLKAELEIRHLHEKIDHLLRRQYQRLFEVQQIQIELLEELAQKKRDAEPRPPVAA